MIAVVDLTFDSNTVVGLLALLGVMYTASKSNAANKAVNGVGKDQPRIYDMVYGTHHRLKAMEAWHDDYEGGPLDNGEKVKNFVAGVKAKDDMLAEIAEEVKLAREEIVEYGCPVKLGKRKPENCFNKKGKES
jgi:hypothetical protein